MLLDRQASQAAKLEGQQLAWDFSQDWKDDVIGEMRLWLQRRKAQGIDTMTMEQFRADAKSQPKSHKAWGALPRKAQAAGLIVGSFHPDGSPRYQPAESVKTHGHPVRVWRIV